MAVACPRCVSWPLALAEEGWAVPNLPWGADEFEGGEPQREDDTLNVRLQAKFKQLGYEYWTIERRYIAVLAHQKRFKDSFRRHFHELFDKKRLYAGDIEEKLLEIFLAGDNEDSEDADDDSEDADDESEDADDDNQDEEDGDQVVEGGHEHQGGHEDSDGWEDID